MLHYVVSGDVRRPCLLFVHGFLGNRHDWEQIVETLSAHALCISIDLPGHGLSTNVPATTFDDAADAIVEILDAEGIPSAILVGYSMGGRIALYTALRHPRRFEALVLESATAGIANTAERDVRQHRDMQLAQELEELELAAFLRWWYSQPLFASLSKRPDLLATMLIRRESQEPKALAGALRAYCQGVQPSLWERLKEIDIPVLLMAGEEDRKYMLVARSLYGRLLEHDRDDVSVRVLRGDGARAHTEHIVPGAGHNVHLEAPAAFSQHLREFVSPTS